jgi:hypothetical protein
MRWLGVKFTDLPRWLTILLVACHATAPCAPGEGLAPGDGAALFYRMVGSGPDFL